MLEHVGLQSWSCSRVGLGHAELHTVHADTEAALLTLDSDMVVHSAVCIQLGLHAASGHEEFDICQCDALHLFQCHALCCGQLPRVVMFLTSTQ